MARADNVLNYKSKFDDDGLLNNYLGINDPVELNRLENIITTYRLTRLYLNAGIQTFDIEHYQRIHKFLFKDIYSFAGELRTEVISKQIPFCLPQFIHGELKKTLDNAKHNINKITNRDELLQFITVLYADLDSIHPFREGNGRTEREYIRQLIDFICKKNGLEEYNLDYSLIKDSKAFLDAIIKADAILDYGDLMTILDSILVVKKKEQKISGVMTNMK